MRNSKKKSPAKSKKKSKKNPLKKYQTAGAGPVVTPTPALGSSSFSPTGSFGTGTLGTSGFSTGNNTYGFNTGSVTGGAPSSSGYLSGNYTPGSTTFNNLYGGYDSGLDTTLNTRTLQDFSEDTNFGQRKDSDASTLDALKPKPKQMTKGEITSTALGAVPGTVGAIANLASSSKIDDPSNYYDKKTRAELERYNKKIKASSAASSVGSGLMATSAAWGPLAWIPAAAGAITMAASEGAKASYQAKQGNLGKSYDERVADRMAYKQRQADKKQQNLDRYSNMNYYGAGSGLAKYGGMREYQAGGLNQEVPLEEEMNIMDPAMDILMNGGIRKYMGGGYQKVTGPSHENGGVPMDLSGDGVIDSELEGGEIIEEMPIMPTMKKGGMKPKKYIYSDHLQTGGMSFAQKFEKMKKEGASPEEIDMLRVEQEIAADRDPNMLYAKYGGMMKYKKGGTANFKPHMMYDPKTGKGVKAGTYEKHLELKKKGYDHREREEKSMGGMMKYGYGGKMEYMKEGGKLPKEVLESRLESHMSEGEAQNYLSEYKGGGLWANIHAKRKRIAAGSGEKMRKPGSEGAPTAKALIESKRDGGYFEYKKGGFKSPAWTRKEGQNPSGGLNAKGRASAKAEGSNLKAPVNSGTNPRRVSFAARFAGMKGPMKNEQGEPTRKALALKKWGFGSEEAARNFANKNKKSAKYGGLMEYQTGGQRVSRTGAGKFFAEYGAPLASVAGAAGDIGMTMSQKYTPVDPISARDVQAEKVFIDRAKDKRVGARESELIGAKRANRAVIGTGATQRENALRMTSLRAQEEAAQNVYDQNRQASATEQQLNQQAQLQADMANQRKDLTTSESRRAESLRKQSFENMRKKYMGSVMGELGNELASGMYRKEYINRTLPPGVDPYEIRPGAYNEYLGKINPDTKKEYTPAEIWNDINIRLKKERK